MLALTALGLAGAAPRASAQAPKAGSPRRIGILVLGVAPKTPVAQRSTSIRLRKLGWIEGENLIVERAYADLNAERLAGLAEELLRRGVELILTFGPEASLAAARATRTVPVVFVAVTWPVEQGLIDSFARPGRNLTGTSFYTGVEVSNKRLEFLREIAPAAKRLSWLWPSDFAETVAGGSYDMIPTMAAAATGLGFEIRFHPIRRTEDIDGAFGEITAWRAQAVAAAGAHVLAARQRIAEFALRHRLPTAYPSHEHVEAGGLLSYAPPPSELAAMGERSVAYVDRILRGAKPAELPVERPSRYELVINAKTAKALGLTIPQSLLVRADRVIE